MQVELTIHGSLRKLMEGRTTLIIAHRLSTISLADRVLLMDAGKIVADLHDRGYVVLGSSPGDARQKVITLTPRARDYLAAQRAAARRIEQELAEQVGSEAFESLFALLEALGGEEDQPPMRDYLRHALRLADDPEQT